VTAGPPAPGPVAALSRRLLSVIYETVLLAAVLLAGALPFLVLARQMEPALARPLFQLYLLLLCGVYFVWQWTRGGQTLPMKTWRLRLVTREGAPLALRHGVLRFLLAVVGLGLFGIGYAWAFADRDRQFLHDRLAGTRIVKDEG
jgi:uncharacterized RDD family membrane protein YckC